MQGIQASAVGGAVLTLAMASAVIGAEPAAKAGADTNAVAEEVAGDLPSMRVVSEGTLNGRKLIRYTYTSMPQWGYATPQSDWFNLMLPKKPGKKAPLCVVLHSAGGNGNEGLPLTKPDNQGLYDDETFYRLCLDCS